MPYIYLHKLYGKEKNRINPDNIRTITRIETDGKDGSLVVFNDNDSIKYMETPQNIMLKEWRMRFLWPNVERALMCIIGGAIGACITLFFDRNK